MQIPPRIHYSGDKSAGKSLIGFAMKRLGDLNTSMKYGGLLTGKNAVRFKNGISVTTTASYGIKNVHVHVPFGAAGEVEETRECFCNCNFSQGFIVTVIPDDDKIYDFLDVEVCNQDKYVQYDTMIGTDFVEWEEGQQVWVIPYYQMQYDCTERTDPSLPTGCNPNEMAPKEDGSPYTPDDDEWRTVYRVIPVCFDDIVEWQT